MGAGARIPLFERLQLETQALCNRACWFCPRSYDATGKYLDARGKAVDARMPTDRVLEILDQVEALGFRGDVGFHHYSEPLLDERNPRFAREALARGMRPYLHTNGDRLRGDDGLRDEVQALYALIVVGLYDYRSDEERIAEEEFWRERLCGANLRFSAISAGGGHDAKNMSVPKALVPASQRFGAPDLVYPNGPCRRPLMRLIIQHDGTMCNCCEDTSGAFGLGNVGDSTIRELWYSERHSRVVEELERGDRRRYALCRSCPLSPSGPRPDGERLEILPRAAVC